MTNSRRDVVLGLATGTVLATVPSSAAVPASARAMPGDSRSARGSGAATHEVFDYIVVGGGWAGCTVAARMSENPSNRVLLLEAGKENDYEHSYYSTGAAKMWEGETNWHDASTPQAGLNGRTIDHPRGRVIGGSAAMNVGSWSRGVASDYEAWERAGATGWGWPTALEAYKRMERSGRPDDGTRGRSGPVHLEDTPVGSAMTDLLREATIAADIGVTRDHNGSDFEGFDLWETVFPYGRRRNTADAYLKTARSRPNLSIRTEARATRVLMEGLRAVGVEFEGRGGVERARASAEVLLCTGAFATPKLLMLSGIGPAAHLKQNGIEVVANLRGVGENLIDHLAAVLGGTAAPGAGVKPVYPDPRDPAQLTEWRRTGYGPLSVTEYTSIAFTRSSRSVDVPDIELLFDINPPRLMREDPNTGGYSIYMAHLTPKSRGQIRLASNDHRAAPAIDFRYLSNEEDARVMVAGVRRAIAVATAAPLAAYQVRRNFDPSSSDDELEKLIKTSAVTMYHPVGTARMGRSGDPAAVLDPELRVRGVRGLRVLDASAMPEIIRGHTMAPTLYIAEQGCELITRRRP